MPAFILPFQVKKSNNLFEKVRILSKIAFFACKKKRHIRMGVPFLFGQTGYSGNSIARAWLV